MGFMRIFISSLINGLEAFRDATERGVRSLGHDVIRVETFPAKSSTPQAACLAGVREADLLVLIIGDRYGEKQASGRSATHEEFLEARDRIPVLIFVQDHVERDPAQQGFLDEVRGWSSGGLYRSFTTPEQLQDAVVRAVHDHELATAVGPIDEASLVEQAIGQLPKERPGHGFGGEPALAVSIAAGPTQQVLRPAEIEDPDLIRAVQREAMFGDNAVLDSAEGTEVGINGDRLVITQRSHKLSLHQNGAVLVLQPVATTAGRGFMKVMVEEDIQASITRAIRFTGWLFDHVDPAHRVTDVVVATTIAGAGHTPWMTRSEAAASNGSYTMGTRGEDPVVLLTPPRQPRQALLHKADAIAEDAVVVLRRHLKR